MTQARSVTAGSDRSRDADRRTAVPAAPVTSSPAGISCGAGNTHLLEGFRLRHPVTLTATPDAGHQLAALVRRLHGVPGRRSDLHRHDGSGTVGDRALEPRQLMLNLNSSATSLAPSPSTGRVRLRHVHSGVVTAQTLTMTASSTYGLSGRGGGACASQGNAPSARCTVTGDTACRRRSSWGGTRTRSSPNDHADPERIYFHVTCPVLRRTPRRRPTAIGSTTGRTASARCPPSTLVMLKAHLPPATRSSPRGTTCRRGRDANTSRQTS